MTDSLTRLDIPVRSTDMDADQVVNNAIYFMYFEQVRLNHLQRFGVIGSPWQSYDVAQPFAIVATEARFLAPTRYPETLHLLTWTREVRTRSFTLGFRARRRSDGVIVVEGSSAQVWLDAAGQATPLPDGVRQALLDTLQPDGPAEDVG